MTRRSIFALALVAAMVAPLAGSTAGAACNGDVTTASAAAPHVVDGTGDWDGVVTGNETGTVPAADVYREGIDITKAWLHRDADGDLTANVEIADLSTLQPNAIFYILWDYTGTEPTKSRRFASGRLKGYGEAFSYGWLGPSSTGATGMTFYTEGDTTGSVTEGAPGVVSVDLPRTGTTFSGSPVTDWGAPVSGATLSNPQAESRFLVGSPEPLPPNPVGLRHGLVYVADTTEDAITICDATVP